MYPQTNGGVAEVCQSLNKGILELGYEVILINNFVDALLFSMKNVFSNNKHVLISNLHYGIFGVYFKHSIFIIHGFPQRKHEGYLRYNKVVLGHKFFSFLNKKTIAVSYFTKFVSENFYNIKVHTVIHNILPFDFFSTALKHKREKAPNTITFVGRVIKEKGVDRILKAVDLIRSEGEKVVVNIIGSGSFIPELKTNFPDTDNIFHGYLSSEKKYEVLSKSNSFISLHPAEPFGITVLEASTLGLHCCLSAIGGHTEFVPHEIFFPINNVHDINEIAIAISKSFMPVFHNILPDKSYLNEDKYYNKYAQQFLNVL